MYRVFFSFIAIDFFKVFDDACTYVCHIWGLKMANLMSENSSSEVFMN